MKKVIFIGIISIMFFYKANASYEKVFFDYKIKSISGEIIDLKEYKGNVVLLVNIILE